jgi:hypothetical protein
MIEKPGGRVASKELAGLATRTSRFEEIERSAL